MTLHYSNDHLYHNMNQNFFPSDPNNNLSSVTKDENFDKSKHSMLNFFPSNSVGNMSNSFGDSLLESHLQQQQQRLSLIANSNSCNNQDLASMDKELGAELMSMWLRERRRSSMLGSVSTDDQPMMSGNDNALASLANKIRRNSLLGSSFQVANFDNLSRNSQGNIMASNLSNNLRDADGSSNENEHQHRDQGSISEAAIGLKNNEGNQLDFGSEFQIFLRQKLQEEEVLRQKLQEEEELRTAISNGGLVDGHNGSDNDAQSQQQQHQMRRLSLIAAMNSLGWNESSTRRNSLASLICGDDIVSRRASLLLGGSFAGSRRNSMLGSTANQVSRSGSLIGAIGAGDSFFPRHPQRRGSLLPIDPNEMEDLFDDNATGSSVTNLAALQMQLQELQQAQIRLASDKKSTTGINNLTMAAADALRRLSNASESAFQNKSNFNASPKTTPPKTIPLEDGEKGSGSQSNSALNGADQSNENNKEFLSQGVDSSIAATTTEIFRAFSNSMNKSQISQKSIQQWDKKMGLKKSHSITMTKTTQSRKMLREMFEQQLRIMFGIIVDLSGKEELGEHSVKKKRGRKKGSKNKKKPVKRDSCSTTSGESENNRQDESDNFADDEHEDSMKPIQENSENDGTSMDKKDSKERSKRRRTSDTSETEENSVASQQEKITENTQPEALTLEKITETSESNQRSILCALGETEPHQDTGEVPYEKLNIPWRKGENSRLDSLSAIASYIEGAEEKLKSTKEMKDNVERFSNHERKLKEIIFPKSGESGSVHENKNK